jgi:nicotinate phosphoribosyltransferase
VLAGQLFGIPVSGTQAHSWVMAFDHEIDAFDAYARALPNNCIFLVDTYDTLEGIENAIRAGRKLREQGYEMAGIRLDSGDLAQLAKRARRRLDAAGFPDALIAASSSLDERVITDLKSRGAPIVLWAVGTKLATAQPDAALDGVYKMGAIREDNGRWSYRMKMSDTPGKSTRPGLQQIRRFTDDNGDPVADLVYDAASWSTAWAGGVGGYEHRFAADDPHIELLEPAIRDGARVSAARELCEIRDYARTQFAYFIERPNYPALTDHYLDESTDALRDWLAQRHRNGRDAEKS